MKNRERFSIDPSQDIPICLAHGTVKTQGVFTHKTQRTNGSLCEEILRVSSELLVSCDKRVSIVSKRVKGQFYIIGSLIIILLMFNAKYSAIVNIEKPVGASQNVFSNAKNEYFNALDAAYASKPTSGNMEDNITSFMDFLNNVSISHAQRFESLAVAFVPKGLGYNVSVWNFLGVSVNASVVLGNVSQTLSLANKASGRLVFNDTAHFIIATVNYTKATGTTINHFNITNRKLGGFIYISMRTSKTTWSDALTSMEEIVTG